jgi:hypothetical protein
MSNEKVAGLDQVSGGLQMGAQINDDSFFPPAFKADFQCIGADGQVRWEAPWQNAVVNQAKVDLINNYLGRTNVAHNSWYVGLHSLAATNVTHSLSHITGSEIGGYSANRASFTVSNTYTTNSATFSVSYGFTGAGPYTVSGAFIGDVAATGGTNGLLYSEGNFGASRQILNLDTLNVTITLSYA